MEKLNDTGDSVISCPIPNIYGSGLGYGLKATFENGEPDGSSGRADGVAVYLKRGAALVLGAVLGNAVFGGSDIKSWEERCEMIRKMNREKGNNSSIDSGKAFATAETSCKVLGNDSATCASPSTPDRRRKSCNNAVSAVRKSCDDPPPYTVAVAKFKDELDQLQSSNRLSAPKKLTQSIDTIAAIKAVKKIDSSRTTKASDAANSASDDIDVEAARTFLSDGVFPAVREAVHTDRPNSSNDKISGTVQPSLSPQRPTTSVCSTRQVVASGTSINGIRQATNQYFLSPIKVKPKRLTNGSASGNKGNRPTRPGEPGIANYKQTKVYQKSITSFSFELPQIKPTEFPIAQGSNSNSTPAIAILVPQSQSLGAVDDGVKITNMITYEEFKKHIQSQKNGPGRSLLRNDARINLISSVGCTKASGQGSANSSVVLAWK